MQPLYNGFNAFKGTDSKAINEAIALAILNAASGKSSLELKSPIILDQIWKAVIPLFDKFYGEGKIQHETKIIKDLLRASIPTVFKNSKKLSDQEIIRTVEVMTKEIYASFSVFKHADTNKLNKAIVAAVAPFASRYEASDIGNSVVFEQIWISVLPVFAPFFGDGLVKKTTKITKELLRQPIMSFFRILSGTNTITDAKTLTKKIGEIMAPVYATFPDFEETDTQKLNENLVILFTPLTTIHAENAEELFKKIVFEQTWTLALPVFRSLYGDGKILKNIAIVKSILKTALTPVLTNQNSKSNALMILRNTNEVLKPIFATFPEFDGVCLKKISSAVVSNLMKVTSQLQEVNMESQAVFELIWESTLPIFDQLYGEGKIKAVGNKLRKAMIPAITEMSTNMIEAMFPIFDQNNIF